MGSSWAVTNARLVTPEGVIENGTLVIADGKIAALNAPVPVESEVFDASGLTVLPGFLDLHIHGGGGADTMDATPDALRTICRIHARFGTTGLLLTTITQTREKISNALRAARDATKTGTPDGAQVLGIHLEGPYIAPERPGAQPKEYVRDYDAAEFAGWLDDAGGTMRQITLAPERPGADELIDACRKKKIVVSFGHTDADADGIARAVECGATQATHLFNAMPPLHHRKPGPVAIALTDKRVRTEIIADGHHVAPEMIRLTLAAKGSEGVILITDAMAGAGASDGLYDLGGHEVTVADGKALLADGTLAGSVLTMLQSAKNVREWCHVDWETLARLTSTNAADQMGWSQKGRIAPGADADFLLLDDDLNLHASFIAGKRL